MTPRDILARLKAEATDRQRERLLKRGVPPEFALGVSKAVLNLELNKLGKDHKLAVSLWRSGYHEMRLLAIRIARADQITATECYHWIETFWSWDITDSFARYLLADHPERLEIIDHCCASNELYVRRSGFAGIACVAQKHPGLLADHAEHFFQLIKSAADDKRQHVRKAVVWAIVEIGKSSHGLQEEALILANEMMEEEGNSAWIGRNSKRELELLTSVEARRRLISSNSKTAKSGIVR